MKVLRDGPAFQRKVECRRCSSLLLVEEGDVQYNNDEQYHFGCGKCHEPNAIGELPEYVKSLAREEFQRGQMYGR